MNSRLRKSKFSPLYILTLLFVSIAINTGILFANENTKALHGIDVSHHNGDVDWKQVKASGVSFAFAKAAEGTGVDDPKFSQNWEAINEAGLIRGAYDFYRVGEDPAAQAKNVAGRVTLKPGDLPIVIDIETMNQQGENVSQLREELTTFIQALESEFGIKPIIYTSPGFWNEHVGGGFGKYPLWVAEYGVQHPKHVDGWDAWDFWQTSQTGKVEGVEGNTDLSVFSGSLEDLQKLTLK